MAFNEQRERFVLRAANEVTPHDIAGQRGGYNDLIALAAEYCDLTQQQFPEGILLRIGTLQQWSTKSPSGLLGSLSPPVRALSISTFEFM